MWEDKMNYCKQCNEPLSDNVAFCHKCGHKVRESHVQVQTKRNIVVPKKKTNICSLLALIFGAIGIIPLLNFLFLPVAVILAIIGLFLSKNRKKGLTIASLIVVIISLIASIAWLTPFPNRNGAQTKSDEITEAANKNEEVITEVGKVINEKVTAEEQYEYLSFPGTVKTDCFEVYIEGVYINSEIRPNHKDGLYSYKSAEDGMEFCYIKGTIKNTAGTSHQVSMLGTCIFDSIYSYDGLMLKDVKNSVDNVSMYETIAPLETVNFYYACAVPKELVNSYNSAKFKLEVITDLWDYDSDTMYNRYCVSFNN